MRIFHFLSIPYPIHIIPIIILFFFNFINFNIKVRFLPNGPNRILHELQWNHQGSIVFHIKYILGVFDGFHGI